jgi:hypothetical protein
MTLYDFVRLNLDFRAEMVWERGELVTNAVDLIGASAFYSLDGFFVEVVYDQENNRIVEVAPFSEGPRYERMVARMRPPLN